MAATSSGRHIFCLHECVRCARVSAVCVYETKLLFVQSDPLRNCALFKLSEHQLIEVLFIMNIVLYECLGRARDNFQEDYYKWLQRETFKARTIKLYIHILSVHICVSLLYLSLFVLDHW